MIPQLQGWEEAMKRPADSPSSFTAYDWNASRVAWVPPGRPRKHKPAPFATRLRKLAEGLKPGNATDTAKAINKLLEEL